MILSFVNHLFIIVFLLLNLLYAQKRTMGLNLGEASTLTLTRAISQNENLRMAAGFGILGIINEPDYYKKYKDSPNLGFLKRGRIYVLNVSLIKRFIPGNGKFGLLLNGGLQTRMVSAFRYLRRGPGFVTMDIPENLRIELMSLVQAGCFFRPGQMRFEYGLNAGLANDLIWIPGYPQFMFDIYISVPF